MKDKKKLFSVQNIIIAVLAILLLIAIVFVVVDKVQENNAKKELAVKQEAFKLGYEQSVADLMNNAATCNPVNLKLQNYTMEVVSVECLKKAQEEYAKQQQGQVMPGMVSQ